MISSQFLIGAPVIEKISEHFAALNKQIALMNFGRVNLPTELAKSPEAALLPGPPRRRPGQVDNLRVFNDVRAR